MNHLERAAQQTRPERETREVNRWEDDGGQVAPMNAALKVGHHQAPSGQMQWPQGSAAPADEAGDSAKKERNT